MLLALKGEDNRVIGPIFFLSHLATVELGAGSKSVPEPPHTYGLWGVSADIFFAVFRLFRGVIFEFKVLKGPI